MYPNPSLHRHARKRGIYLEYKCLVEDGVERLLVHFGVKLLLLVGEEQDFDVRIGGST